MSNIDLPARVFLAHGSEITRACKDDEKKQRHVFENHFGCSPEVAAELWSLLLLHTDGFMTEKSSPYDFLCGLLLLKLYNTEEVLAKMARCHPDTFRKWSWHYVYALSYLEQEVVCSTDAD